MSKTKIGSNAIFTGTGKGLTIIGNHCYAYSGDVSVSASNTTMLDFTSGKEYIIAQFEYHGTIAQIASNQLAIEVKLNGNSIIHTYFDATVDHTLWDSPPTILIPPLSNVTITLAQASGADRNMQVTLVGKVYNG